MPNHQPVRIDVVSDVVCPWCFIGKRRLEKAIALNPDIPLEVHYRPYFLNDWIPREGIPREEYLTTKFGQFAPDPGHLTHRSNPSGNSSPSCSTLERSTRSMRVRRGKPTGRGPFA